MKPNEIVNLDEDWRQKVAGNAIGNWLARKGAFGTKTAVTAQGVNMAKGQAELSKAAENVLKAKLLQQLEAGLRNAFNAGIVAEMSFSKKNLNRLIENTIINEAMSVDQYVNQFIKNLLSKYQITPDQNTALNNLALKLKAKYTGPDQPFPKEEASKLIDFVFGVKSMNTGDEYPEPTGAETVTTQRGVYDFTPGSGWTQTHKMIIGTSGRPVPQPLPSPLPITDEKAVKQLNKLAAQV